MMSLRRPRADLASVIGFFTRLPVTWLMPREGRVDLAGAVWAFPLAGGLVGLCGALVYALGSRAGLSPLLCAAWTLAAMLLLTGALHEDGMADTADGCGGGRTVSRKLEIMRDSRIGSYGALALLLSSLVRIVAMAELRAPWRVATGLVVAGVLSRAAIVLLLVLLPPARRDGVAATLHPIAALPALLAIGLALAIDGALLEGWMRLACPLAALLTGLGATRFCRRQLGGHTGDVLGASAVLVECVVLSLLSGAAPR